MVYYRRSYEYVISFTALVSTLNLKEHEADDSNEILTKKHDEIYLIFVCSITSKLNLEKHGFLFH